MRIPCQDVYQRANASHLELKVVLAVGFYKSTVSNSNSLITWVRISTFKENGELQSVRFVISLISKLLILSPFTSGAKFPQSTRLLNSVAPLCQTNNLVSTPLPYGHWHPISRIMLRKVSQLVFHPKNLLYHVTYDQSSTLIYVPLWCLTKKLA